MGPSLLDKCRKSNTSPCSNGVFSLAYFDSQLAGGLQKESVLLLFEGDLVLACRFSWLFSSFLILFLSVSCTVSEDMEDNPEAEENDPNLDQTPPTDEPQDSGDAIENTDSDGSDSNNEPDPSPVEPASCNYNSQTIASGASITVDYYWGGKHSPGYDCSTPYTVTHSCSDGEISHSRRMHDLIRLDIGTTLVKNRDFILGFIIVLL